MCAILLGKNKKQLACIFWIRQFFFCVSPRIWRFWDAAEQRALIRWYVWVNDVRRLTLSHTQQCINSMLLTVVKTGSCNVESNRPHSPIQSVNFDIQTFTHLYVRFHLEFLFWETQSHWVATLQSIVIFWRDEDLWSLTQIISNTEKLPQLTADSWINLVWNYFTALLCLSWPSFQQVWVCFDLTCVSGKTTSCCCCCFKKMKIPL